jgi:anthranilate phosphoribosyltransferase
MMKSIIKKLVHTPSEFTPTDASDAINAIMNGDATQSQIASFLVSLRLQQKDEDPEIVAACATAMRSHAHLVPFESYEHVRDTLVDIVGTGGDGHDTYNVSTTASIVSAGAGAKVAKVNECVR